MRLKSLICLLGICLSQPALADIEHLVFLWLKPGTSEQVKQHIIEQSQALAELPEVAKVNAGTPVESDRPIVDDSFDIGIVFSFKDKQALNAFAQNPVHLKFVGTQVKPVLDKILIYDIEH